MRYKITIAYDGSDYCGWQVQAKGRSVQQELERVVSTINKQKTAVTGSGRTDAGVHAKGQCAHFDSELPLTLKEWKSALRGLLPADIWLKKIERVDSRFHARFDVIEKTYCYRLNMGQSDIFARKQEYQLGQNLDVAAMREAATAFMGTHDFTSFNSTPIVEVPDQSRTVSALKIIQNQKHLRIEITADGFLRYMVRMIVAALVRVGQHKLDKGDIIYLLKNPSKQAFDGNVPSCGLYLMRVKY